MKKIFLAFIVTAFFAVNSLNVIADPPGPPAPGGGSPSGSGGTPVGAPIDSGVYVLITLGAAYGLRKIYEMRKKEDQKEVQEE